MARENASHAPGNEIGRGDGGTRQHFHIGEGDGPMKGESFGVGPLPGTRRLPAMGDHVKHDGLMMADEHRAGPPPLHMGEGNMHATAHSHHGPHHHDHEHHHQAPEGPRPHHVGHHELHKEKRRGRDR